MVVHCMLSCISDPGHAACFKYLFNKAILRQLSVYPVFLLVLWPHMAVDVSAIQFHFAIPLGFVALHH